MNVWRWSNQAYVYEGPWMTDGRTKKRQAEVIHRHVIHVDHENGDNYWQNDRQSSATRALTRRSCLKAV